MELYGKNSIRERLRTDPASIKRIYCRDTGAAASVSPQADRCQVPWEILPERVFARKARDRNTQGVIAEVVEFVYADFDSLLAPVTASPLTFIALSDLTDPQNLGSIIRSLACFGNFAVLLPEHNSVPVNETVLRVACGGESHVPVCRVKNLSAALERLKQAGYWILGALADAPEDTVQGRINTPACIVIGSEGAGIRKGVRKHLDAGIRIPMPGRALSLNAAVSCAIFAYELTRRRLSAQETS